MRAIMTYSNPFSEFSLFPELGMVSPYIFEDSVHEKLNETSTEYQLEYSVPGMKKKDLKMTVNDGVLTIEGYHKESEVKWFKKYNSYCESSFVRSFVLSEDMNIDRIKAKFKNDKLSIQIPKKKEHIDYREIPVGGSNIEVEEAQIIKENKSASLFDSAKKKLQSIFRISA